ncbi:unnamed protein product [Moneuplotes crassus]|uniref:AP2/ERF domain-containing protein n=1 Tax=Euplotes crassus TaxID=5936 RepID=A0AAD1YA07_EUPCR|nr:unnamed protein product [Moneuplotes crassus]
MMPLFGTMLHVSTCYHKLSECVQQKLYRPLPPLQSQINQPYQPAHLQAPKTSAAPKPSHLPTPLRSHLPLSMPLPNPPNPYPSSPPSQTPPSPTPHNSLTPSSPLPNPTEPTKTSEATQEIKKRRRRSSRLEIRSKLIRVRAKILKQGISRFCCSQKKDRGRVHGCSTRRSKYIGVSKNNTHWQALINIGRTKKYIGIFLSETDAARTYDLYAIAIKGTKAHLNFNYTSSEMISMIDHFLQHREVIPF